MPPKTEIGHHLWICWLRRSFSIKCGAKFLDTPPCMVSYRCSCSCVYVCLYVCVLNCVCVWVVVPVRCLIARSGASACVCVVALVWCLRGTVVPMCVCMYVYLNVCVCMCLCACVSCYLCMVSYRGQCCLSCPPSLHIQASWLQSPTMMPDVWPHTHTQHTAEYTPLNKQYTHSSCTSTMVPWGYYNDNKQPKLQPWKLF